MSQFKPGDPRTKTGGRRKGSRDRIETKMLEAIARDFEEHGEEAIRICRVERPNEYLKLVASLLPREGEATIDGNVEVTHQIEHIKTHNHRSEGRHGAARASAPPQGRVRSESRTR